jgi:hypothetical protein
MKRALQEFSNVLARKSESISTSDFTGWKDIAVPLLASLALVPHLKSLRIDCHGDQKQKFWKAIAKMIPVFENLEHLRIPVFEGGFIKKN